MRSKENAQDYRYFPEPDLVPIEISDEWIERVRKSLPELPTEKKERYMKEYKLPEYDVDIITGTKALVKIFEEANAVCNNPKEVSNWIMVEVLRLASETNTDPDDISFDPKNLGVLINLVKNGVVNRNTAKEEVLAKMFSDNVDPEQYIKDNNLQMVSDDSLVRDIVTAVIAANPNSIEQYKEGNEKVVKFLMGQSMKQLKGKANPAVVTKVLEEELAKL